jgi:diguanylate cyclase (GGDEF)-like protein
MWKKFYYWRYYSLGNERYYECIHKLFMNNLLNLRKANTIVAVFAGCFSILTLIMEKNLVKAAYNTRRLDVFLNIIMDPNIIKAGICLAAGLIALLLAVFTHYKMQTAYINSRFIYILTTVFYANLILFGIYLSVWSSPDKLATIFLCFLICAPLMFINPPPFNLFLTTASIIGFSVSAIFVKSFDNWSLDIINALIAGFISLYFTWYIGKLQLGLELSTTMLEDERDSYFDQSTIDELTQLKNRRDFQQTFKRYLTNYRTSDNWLCVAIIDIDFFKLYNDHYGHPGGDACLRSVGKVLNSLKDSHDVYAARVGGEEFALLWFETETSHVDIVVSHLQKLIKELNIPHEKSKVSSFVSISMGIFIEECGAPTDTQTMYDMADKALYNAKEGGRNCAIISGSKIEQYKITP